MRTTINISQNVIKEAELFYGSENRSKAVEEALIDAIRMKKLQKFRELAGNLDFELESEDIEKIRSQER